jgi:CspA family cold shock protein
MEYNPSREMKTISPHHTESEVKRVRGTVKRWLDRKGYGFIQPEEGEDDIFVHYSEVKNSYALKEGQTVEFDIETTPKGPRAINLNVVE